MEIEDLLNDLEFKDILERNDIDINNILDLNEDLIKELFPSIGQRMKFLSKFRNIKNENQERISHTVPNSPASTSASVPSDSVIQLDEQQLSEVNIQDFIVIPPHNREVSARSLEELLVPIEFPNFDLETLLSTSPIGLSIINFYKKNGKLEKSHRNKLTDIIVKHIFNFIVKHRLRHEEFNILTSKIVTLFPSEFPGTYYVPAVKKKDSKLGRPILAKGKLVDKCKNLLHSCADVIPRKRSSESSEETENRKISKLNVEELHGSLKDDILWLKFKNEPWEEVLQKWKNTFEIRQNTQDVNSVDEFYKSWPILKDLRAETLINLDFERVYPQSTLKLILNWETAFNKILQLQNKCKDEYALQLLSIIKDNETLEENKFAAQLLILPYIIPPKGRLHFDKKTVWKFSSAEAAEALLRHAREPGDIELIIADQKKKALVHKQKVQPYIIVEGVTLTTINNVYIVVDDIKYQFNDCKIATDVCFKLFHVINIKYPPQAEHIWLLIQQGIYEIYTKHDTVIPSLIDIIEFIKKPA